MGDFCKSFFFFISKKGEWIKFFKVFNLYLIRNFSSIAHVFIINWDFLMYLGKMHVFTEALLSLTDKPPK